MYIYFVIRSVCLDGALKHHHRNKKRRQSTCDISASQTAVVSTNQYKHKRTHNDSIKLRIYLPALYIGFKNSLPPILVFRLSIGNTKTFKSRKLYSIETHIFHSTYISIFGIHKLVFILQRRSYVD